MPQAPWINCILDFKSNFSIFHNSVLLLVEGKPEGLSTFTGTDWAVLGAYIHARPWCYQSSCDILSKVWFAEAFGSSG